MADKNFNFQTGNLPVSFASDYKNKKNPQSISGGKISISKSSGTGYNASGYALKLASAVTISQVYTLRNHLSLLYTRIKQGGENSSKTAVILASIKRLIQKADVKISCLKIENDLEAKKERAKKDNELEREKKLGRELNVRRKKRKERELYDIVRIIKYPELPGWNGENNSTSEAPAGPAETVISAPAIDISL